MSLHARLRMSTDDRGAFAILYGAAIVLFIMFAAIVVDLGSARFDRRINRSAADSAALGAVTLLQSDSRDAPKACKKAWKYLRSSIHSPDLTTMTDAEIDTACAPFAGLAGICPATTVA